MGEEVGHGSAAGGEAKGDELGVGLLDLTRGWAGRERREWRVLVRSGAAIPWEREDAIGARLKLNSKTKTHNKGTLKSTVLVSEFSLGFIFIFFLKSFDN